MPDPDGDHMLLRWTSKPALQVPCPQCRSIEPKTHVVSARVSSASDETHDYFICSQCQTLFVFPFHQPDYEVKYFSDYSRFYCEVGAGIDFMIRPIVLATNMFDLQSLLDIGYGFGFTLDFFQRMFGGRAIGFEPSPEGAKGRELFAVDIRNAYFNEETTKDLPTCDLIFSSEVIEHVEDPLSFLALVRRFLSNNGLFVCTTPNALWISPKKDVNRVFAGLSPGLHRQIFSEKSLFQLLQSAGFLRAKIFVCEERLIGFASDNLDVDKISALLPVERQIYRKYLLSLLSDPRLSDTEVYSGALFRALKEAVNLGDAGHSSVLMEKMRGLLKAKTGFDFFSISEISAYQEILKKDFELTKLPTYHFPCTLYYLGMGFLNFRSDPWLAAMLFEAAAQVVELMLAYPWAVSEAASLYWLIVYHAGVAALLAGRRRESLNWFDKIFYASTSMPNELLLTTLSLRDVARAKVQAGVAHLQLGERAAARSLLKEALEAPHECLTRDERNIATRLLHEIGLS